MSVDLWPRPGIVLMGCGAVLLGLSAARIATGWDPGPGWLWFEFGIWSAGTALGLWGWSRLRRAKAARPDLNWWQFLRADLIGLGIAGVLLTGLAAMPREQRAALGKSLRDFTDILHIARGHP